MVLRATLTGFISGLMLAALVYLLGSLNAAGVKMSAYLPQVLPDAIRQILYGLSSPSSRPLSFDLHDGHGCARWTIRALGWSWLMAARRGRPLGSGAWSRFQQRPSVQKVWGNHLEPL